MHSIPFLTTPILLHFICLMSQSLKPVRQPIMKARFNNSFGWSVPANLLNSSSVRNSRFGAFSADGRYFFFIDKIGFNGIMSSLTASSKTILRHLKYMA